MNAEEGTPEADELDTLSTLVELYEERHFLTAQHDPTGASRFRMKQADLSARNLIPSHIPQL